MQMYMIRARNALGDNGNYRSQFCSNVHGATKCLEEKNMSLTLEQQNNHLNAQLMEIKSCLHLQDDLMTFNDGQSLVPGFGDGDWMLTGPEVLIYQSDIQNKPLDPLHDNAIAFHGCLIFDFGFKEWPHKLVLGKEDK